MLIPEQVATGRKTATIGVVGLKTDGADAQKPWTCIWVVLISALDTKVPLEDSEGYENITVMQDLGQ